MMRRNPIRYLNLLLRFRLKRFRSGRRFKTEDYSKGAFMAVEPDGKDGETSSISVDDVHGSTVQNAVLLSDAAENGDVYCVST